MPAAYLNYHLTGDYVADLSDSAGTSWLDINARDWSNTLLSLGGMDLSQMPKLVEGCDTAGMLRQDLRQKWGLKQDVVIAGGAGDNAAAACGIGAFKEGQGFVSLGDIGRCLDRTRWMLSRTRNRRTHVLSCFASLGGIKWV